MKTVHLFRSEPGEMVDNFIEEISKKSESEKILLYKEPVDYELCIEKIFESERVVSWW